MKITCIKCKSILDATANNFNNTLLSRIVKKNLQESTCKTCYNLNAQKNNSKNKLLGLSRSGNEVYRRKFDNTNVLKNKSGYIYVVGYENGPYKVGMTTGNIKNRLTALQTASPKEINLYYTSLYTDSIFELEDKILCELKSFNIKGEWFDINLPNLLEIVEKMCCFNATVAKKQQNSA